MYQFKFYKNSNLFGEFNNITSVEHTSSSGYVSVPEQSILDYHYPLNANYILKSDNGLSIISSEDYTSIRISKK